MKLKLLMLADDFTGALDSSAHLVKDGIDVMAAVDAGDIPTDSGCEVLVVNTDTRHDPPAAAYEKTRKLLTALGPVSELIYIKTDSALRGNISAALYAAVTFQGRPLMFVPAFPAFDRTTREGFQYVGQDLLEDSVFRNDPLNPTRQSYVPAIAAADFPVDCIPVREGALDVLDEEPESGKVYLFDCTREATLEAIAQKLAERDLCALTAGCAGFAAALPRMIPFSRRDVTAEKSDSPLLVFSGSANAITLKQLRAARDKGYEAIVLPEALKRFPEQNSSVYDTVLDRARACLRAGRSVIVTTALDAGDLSDMPAPQAEKDGGQTNIHDRIPQLFARLADTLIEDGLSRNLAVFGGDTALAILRKAGCRFVHAKGEAETGVPICEAYCRAGTVHLATKSGGLGSEQVVASIEQFLRRNKSCLQ